MAIAPRRHQSSVQNALLVGQHNAEENLANFEAIAMLEFNGGRIWIQSCTAQKRVVSQKESEMVG